MKQTAITKSARGKACTMKLDGCDSGVNNEKVVFCHENIPGVGFKARDRNGHDIGFYGCHNCHQIYDSLVHPYYKPHFIKEMAQFALSRTKRQLIKQLLVDEHYPDTTLDGYGR